LYCEKDGPGKKSFFSLCTHIAEKVVVLYKRRYKKSCEKQWWMWGRGRGVDKVEAQVSLTKFPKSEKERN